METPHANAKVNYATDCQLISVAFCDKTRPSFVVLQSSSRFVCTFQFLFRHIGDEKFMVIWWKRSNGCAAFRLVSLQKRMWQLGRNQIKKASSNLLFLKVQGLQSLQINAYLSLPNFINKLFFVNYSGFKSGLNIARSRVG